MMIIGEKPEIIKAQLEVQDFILESYETHGVLPCEDTVLWEVLKVLKNNKIEDTDDVMEEMFSDYQLIIQVIKLNANPRTAPLAKKDGDEIERLVFEEVIRVQQEKCQPSLATCKVISLITGVDYEEVMDDIIRVARI